MRLSHIIRRNLSFLFRWVIVDLNLDCRFSMWRTRNMSVIHRFVLLNGSKRLSMREENAFPTHGSVPDLIISSVFSERALLVFRDTWCVRCACKVWVGICHFCRWIGKFSTGSRDLVQVPSWQFINSSRSLVRRLPTLFMRNACWWTAN